MDSDNKIVIAAEDKIPVSQKIAYGFGTVNNMWGNWLYPSIVWPVFNIFLHVNPALVSLAMMINRLVDAFSDPIFGWLSDNTRTRFGRRRPYILAGSILAGLSLPALFMVSPDWSERTIFFYMVISSGIFITIVSCFNMPYQSLGNELTPDYNERTNLFAYKGAIQKIGEVGTFFAATFIILSIFNDATTGEPNILMGARIYSLILGGIMIVSGILVFSLVKERYYVRLVDGKQQRVSIWDTIWKALKCRPFVPQLSMALAVGIGFSGVVLASTGFDAELGASQSAEALKTIRILFLAIPIGGLLLAHAAFKAFGLDRKTMLDIRTQLEQKRGKV